MVRTGRHRAAVDRWLCQGRRAADPAAPASHQPVPDAPGVQLAPQRDRDAALHPPARGQGSRARSHDDPARLVHDEAQRHQRDDPDHLAGVRQRAPVRAGRPAGRLCTAQRPAVRLAGRGHRLRRHQPAAQRRLAGRVRRVAGDPCLARLAQRRPPQHLPDPRIGARHQSCQRASGRHERGGGQVRRARQRRHGRPGRQVRSAQREPGRDHDHLSLHLRRLRHAGQGAVCTRASARWPGVRGRREHECAGWRGRAGRVRRRRQPPQPAQDLLHPARWRRPRRRAGLRGGGSGALPARAQDDHRRRAPGRCGLGRAAGQCRSAADQLDVHAHDGQPRA